MTSWHCVLHRAVTRVQTQLNVSCGCDKHIDSAVHCHVVHLYIGHPSHSQSNSVPVTTRKYQ
ncbi:hypothetical protein L210DRAFT_3548097 [Boletus edulis BED1]|uniref:Uncharacterized protein n=1 Tax=Boletus edulis BED1 TaxID=1328754 RepID=A0AAD4GD72_BOLED|nr:hypothetical protein L210DRAFT_3548097 [Boletus edulis BED1]